MAGDQTDEASTAARDELPISTGRGTNAKAVAAAIAEADVFKPYGAALKQAIDKLTSEVFLFLIAYVILLVGAELLAPGLTRNYRYLFYILPIVGIGAYLFQRSRHLAKQSREQLERSVTVSSTLAHDATVVGVRGEGADIPEEVAVVSRMALGGSEIIGVDVGRGSSDARLEYLSRLFEKLDEADRDALVSRALELTRDPPSAESRG